jgi:hypothetical protein
MSVAPHRKTQNEEFLRFAAHWGFQVRACRPYRAQTKGKVERPVSYLRGNFVYVREFVSDADLEARLQRWLDRTANVRIHGTTKVRPVVRFQEEKSLLLPLAERSYRSLALPLERKTEPSSTGRITLPRIPVERTRARRSERRAREDARPSIEDRALHGAGGSTCLFAVEWPCASCSSAGGPSAGI